MKRNTRRLHRHTYYSAKSFFMGKCRRNGNWQQGITLFTVTDKICRIYPVEFNGQFAQFAKMNFKA